MRFNEIGQQLRAYRLESGLRAEEIAARLGVSRAALYRYEKGEVIKLDTVQRLAELLKISPLSLLGIGVEYYNRPVGYLERIRQIEEGADQVLQVHGAFPYLTSTGALDAAIAEVFDEIANAADGDNRIVRTHAEQVLNILAARKRSYAQRRPGIIAILPLGAIRRTLQQGVCGGLQTSDRVMRLCRAAAAAEIENVAGLMEAEPMSLQLGILTGPEPTSLFKVLRMRERASLAVNPFRADGHPASQAGVAMITTADEAVAAHQRTAEQCWRDAVKGAAAAQQVRSLLAASAQQAVEEVVTA